MEVLGNWINANPLLFVGLISFAIVFLIGGSLLEIKSSLDSFTLKFVGILLGVISLIGFGYTAAHFLV